MVLLSWYWRAVDPGLMLPWTAPSARERGREGKRLSAVGIRLLDAAFDSTPAKVPSTPERGLELFPKRASVTIDFESRGRVVWTEGEACLWKGWSSTVFAGEGAVILPLCEGGPLSGCFVMYLGDASSTVPWITGLSIKLRSPLCPLLFAWQPAPRIGSTTIPVVQTIYFTLCQPAVADPTHPETRRGHLKPGNSLII